MRALVVTEHGPPDVLRVEERPDPQPEAGQLLVRVRCAGINFADVLARQGLYPDAPPVPCVVGYEFSGDVVESGPGVDGFAPGDRVMGACRFGGYSELVAAAEREVMRLPDGWTYAEGTALPGNYATAHAALVRYGALRAGERVLIHSAGGGVGIAAAQLARAIGAEVVGVASEWKHEALRELGIERLLDARSGEVMKRARELMGEQEPFDVVLDTLGGRSPLESYALTRAGGRVVCVGSAGMVSGDQRDPQHLREVLRQSAKFSAQRLMLDSKSVIGLNLLRLRDVLGDAAEHLHGLAPFIESGAIRPVIAATFPLADGPEAHRLLEQRRNVGKVVLEVA